MSKPAILFLITLLACAQATPQERTYAERLGFPKDARVLIMHVDDVGMSWESNQGAIEALEQGVATSLSIMMPCPWVPGFAHYLKQHPALDAGLHLTLTSEWRDYRWAPLTGTTAKGLTDDEGAFWSSVRELVQHASADEVDAEISAQLQRARNMGFEPTHFDTHMGALFASPEFLERYMKLGIRNKIPVMIAGGHLALFGTKRTATECATLREKSKVLWEAGLPVLDDLHNISYGFQYPEGELTDDGLRKIATSQYIKSIRALKPGLTMVITHCSRNTETFRHITSSATLRRADLLAMTDPVFKKFLEDEKIILTTWREVMRRRAKI